MKVNKFNIHWQIARVKARSIKDVAKKTDFVMNFLFLHPNKFNYERVLNWMKMTSIAYPESSKDRMEFSRCLKYLEDNKHLYQADMDTNNNLSVIPTDELEMVLDDLEKRKYGFQFKQVPKDHIEFVAQLENELETR